MRRAICFVETDGEAVLDASRRAVSLARSVVATPRDLVVVVVDRPSPLLLAELSSLGVGVVRHLRLETGWSPLRLALALGSLLEEGDLGVAAATDHGNEVLAHLAAIRGLDFAANCTAVMAASDEGYRLVRQRWGGSLIEDAMLSAASVLVSVATDADVVLPAPADGSPDVGEVLAGESHPLETAALESAEDSAGISLSNAKVVVSGGRGVGGPEGFAALEELAGLLGGAVGVSRVVTSLGWRPHREQVGQTGTRVAPELYLACGISGAIQHLAGCQAARHMIAINTDPDAPIMARADYAVIGDVGVVVPALVEALRDRLKRGS